MVHAVGFTYGACDLKWRMSLTIFLRWTVLVALFFTSFVRVKIKNSYEQNSDYYATTTTKIVLYNVIYSMGAYIKFVW